MTISGFVAYVKQAWKNKPDTSTPLSAARLTHLEDGIKGNSDAIEKIAAAVVSQIVNDPNKIASMAALYNVNQAVTQLNSDLGALQAELTITQVDISQYKTASIVDTTSICYLQQYGNIALISLGTVLLKYQKTGSNIIFTIPGYTPRIKTTIMVRASNGNAYAGSVFRDSAGSAMSIQLDNLPTGDLYVYGQFIVMLN